MRTLKIALLATVATAALSSATYAADLIIAADPVIDNYAPVSDWEGPYIGVFVSGQTTPAAFGLGANLGVNVLVDESLLVGFEGEFAWIGSTPSSFQGQVDARLGFIADPALVYAFVGAGFNSETDGYIPVGVGVEFMVTSDVSIKAEYQYQWDFDNGAESAHVGKFGINWHF